LRLFVEVSRFNVKSRHWSESVSLLFKLSPG
jgi:hypothetical protein